MRGLSALPITTGKLTENQTELEKDNISWTRTSEHELLSERSMLNMAYYNR